MTDSFRKILQNAIAPHAGNDALQRSTLQRVLLALGVTDPPKVEVTGRARSYTWHTPFGPVVLREGEVQPLVEVTPAPRPLQGVGGGHLLLTHFVNEANADAVRKAVEMGAEPFRWAFEGRRAPKAP